MLEPRLERNKSSRRASRSRRFTVDNEWDAKRKTPSVVMLLLLLEEVVDTGVCSSTIQELLLLNSSYGESVIQTNRGR